MWFFWFFSTPYICCVVKNGSFSHICDSDKSSDLEHSPLNRCFQVKMHAVNVFLWSFAFNAFIKYSHFLLFVYVSVHFLANLYKQLTTYMLLQQLTSGWSGSCNQVVVAHPEKEPKIFLQQIHVTSQCITSGYCFTSSTDMFGKQGGKMLVILKMSSKKPWQDLQIGLSFLSQTHVMLPHMRMILQYGHAFSDR